MNIDVAKDNKIMIIIKGENNLPRTFVLDSQWKRLVTVEQWTVRAVEPQK